MTRRFLTGWMFVALFAAWPRCSSAQDPDAGLPGVTTVPWAYASYFGTGWYRIGDDRDAFAIRYVYRKRLREGRIREDGTRQIGVEWRVPVTLGLNEFPLEDIQGSVDPENFANLSANPGVWLDLPVNERWTLRSHLAAGWGSVLNGDESAWTYWGGIASRYLLVDGSRRLALINALGFVGYTPSEGPTESFQPIMTGLEFRHPLLAIVDGRDRLRLHWQVAHTHFRGQLDLNRPDGSTEQVSEQWEVGFAVSREQNRLRFGWLSFDRLGFAYRFSGDGELEGVGLVFNSLFDE